MVIPHKFQAPVWLDRVAAVAGARVAAPAWCGEVARAAAWLRAAGQTAWTEACLDVRTRVAETDWTEVRDQAGEVLLGFGLFACVFGVFFLL
jgi:hypothetical protein